MVLFFVLFCGCTKKETTRLENDFNINLKLDNSYHIIDLKSGRFTTGISHADEDIVFVLDSIELLSIFNCVPWDVIAELPAYYNPVSDGKFVNARYNELVITNGKLTKQIRLEKDAVYPDSLVTNKLFHSIEKMTEIMENKLKVKIEESLRFECNLIRTPVRLKPHKCQPICFMITRLQI